MKRDPTMYVDGHSYPGDPPLKAKRDPTMYIEGQRQPSVYFEDEPGPLPLRDPTMYIGGNPIYDSDDIDQWGRTYGTEEPLPNLDRSDRTYGSDIEPPNNRRRLVFAADGGTAADSYQFEMENMDESFRTQDPSVSGKKGRSKKSQKSSRKSSKSKSSSRY
mmetsp:Transcript_2148/g.3849  ORF Transcript_2148/g.3849 Transcript_2148/m.3849 type:complete len:161 (+) Transcript_2148:1344-1826(+)